MIFQLDDELWFPDPKLAEEDGLLAVGGDLRAERLLLGYQNGIFPWFSDDTPILWYSPHERWVIFPEKVKVSKSMRQVQRSGKYDLTVDKDFRQVIKNCATVDRGEDQPGTWITAGMRDAYIQLHELGYAHSIEVWEDEELVGGLYGIAVGQVFCGESMFSKRSNASKMALIALCKEFRFKLIDCQLHTSHLESMGAEALSREEYMQILNQGLSLTEPSED